MGFGKTTAAINFINQSDMNIKFLYITPYLNEVERIIKCCPSRRFEQPKVYGTKIQGIKVLFEKGKNIVSTHALFREFDEEVIDLAYNNNYILIMDEVADVIESLDISDWDLKIILEKFATIDNNHLLKWKDNTYTGKYDEYKRLCDIDCVGVYENRALVWLFPLSTFKAFKDIYILTYLFNAQTQKYYYDYYGVEYNYLHIIGDNPDNYKFTNEEIPYQYPDYHELIHIIDNDKLNEIGDLDNALSKNWYIRNENNLLILKLKNNCVNFYTNYTKTKSQFNLWTTFKKWKVPLSGKGYSKGFLSSNMRATNEYRNRTAVAYLVNKFFNPCIKKFFNENGVKVDEDAYALSEMLQFIWRSAIRDNKEITIYIPSVRMRELLIKWINTISDNSEYIDHDMEISPRLLEQFSAEEIQEMCDCNKK